MKDSENEFSGSLSKFLIIFCHDYSSVVHTHSTESSNYCFLIPHILLDYEPDTTLSKLE